MHCTPLLTRPFWRSAIATALFMAVLGLLPRWWCGRDADRWFYDEPEVALALSRDVAATIQNGVSKANFTNDQALFRSEWQFGTYQMGALGLLQFIRAHPEHRAEFLPAVENAIDHILSPEIRAFDARMWKEDALDSLDGLNGHAAYLGYLNFVLCLHRQIVTNSRFSTLNDRISAALDRRLNASSHGILETYPGEGYPIDNAAGVASLILHQKITGTDHSSAVTRTLACYRSRWRDPSSGLLYQAIGIDSGRPMEDARASGTALAAAFLGSAERNISQSLFAAIRKNLSGSLLGFGYINEYPQGLRGAGDVDSGPVIFGTSISGTGFTLATARIFDDRSLFTQLYRTAHFVGVPVRHGDRLTFATGGPLGNSIMLAMLTAPKSQP